MKNLLLALVALALVPTVALAGGGTKATGKINVKNNSTVRMGVIVDPPATLNPATTTEAQFLAAGGKFVDAGATASFTQLKSGAHTVVVFPVASTIVTTSQVFTLAQGGTLNVGVTFDAAGAATLVLF